MTELITILETDDALNPCQLEKKFGSSKIACNMICAFENNCPVFYVDSHEMPLIRKINQFDLDPIG